MRHEAPINTRWKPLQEVEKKRRNTWEMERWSDGGMRAWGLCYVERGKHQGTEMHELVLAAQSALVPLANN